MRTMLHLPSSVISNNFNQLKLKLGLESKWKCTWIFNKTAVPKGMHFIM